MKKTVLFIILLLNLSSFSLFAQSQLRLSLQAGVQIPTGDFADFAGTGFGLNGTFEYWQNTPLSFTGSIGYNSWGPKNDLPNGWDYSLTAIPVEIGFRYYMSRGDFHPYLGAELGIVFISSEFTHEVGNTLVTISDSDQKFGFVPMFGFRYHVNASIDLDFNLKYNVITTEDNSTTYMGINGGVQFGL